MFGWAQLPPEAIVIARLRKLLSDLSEAFWLVPGLIVAAGVLSAVGLVSLDRGGVVPQWLIG